MLAAKSSLCGRIWTIQPSSGNPPPVRWNLTSQHRHKDTHTLLASFLWSPPTKYTSPPELQFIHTATGSRTVRQVVNKGHGFVLSADKKENRGFFFSLFFFVFLLLVNNLLAERCRSCCETATAPRLKRDSLTS